MGNTVRRSLPRITLLPIMSRNPTGLLKKKHCKMKMMMKRSSRIFKVKDVSLPIFKFYSVEGSK